MLEGKSGWIVAAGRAAAAGGFIATTLPLGISTNTLPGGAGTGIYLWTLGEGVDLIVAVPLAAAALLDRGVIVAQASDTTFNTTTMTMNTGVAVDAINHLAVIRTSIG